MKKTLAIIALASAMAILCLPAAIAQNFGSVKGECKDIEGKPIVGATVEFNNSDTGRKYALKTNNKGEYFSLGLEPGKYKVILMQEGKILDSVTNFPVQLGDNTVDFDLKKSQNEAAQQKGISPEQLKQMQEQQEKATKDKDTVKTLNEKLAAATASEQAGDFDAAITTLTEATQVDPSRDLLWFKLGDAYRLSAAKVTDNDEKNKRLASSVSDIEKAVEMKKKAIDAGEDKSPDAPKQLAAYYNNLGDSYAKTGNTEGAVKAYNQAATLNPPSAGQYYFNLGATMTNANKANDPAMRKAAVEARQSHRRRSHQGGLFLLEGYQPDWNGNFERRQNDRARGYRRSLPEVPGTQPHRAACRRSQGDAGGIGATVETSYGAKKKPTKK